MGVLYPSRETRRKLLGGEKDGFGDWGITCAVIGDGDFNFWRERGEGWKGVYIDLQIRNNTVRSRLEMHSWPWEESCELERSCCIL